MAEPRSNCLLQSLINHPLRGILWSNKMSNEMEVSVDRMTATGWQEMTKEQMVADHNALVQRFIVLEERYNKLCQMVKLYKGE